MQHTLKPARDADATQRMEDRGRTTARRSAAGESAMPPLSAPGRVYDDAAQRQARRQLVQRVAQLGRAAAAPATVHAGTPPVQAVFAVRGTELTAAEVAQVRRYAMELGLIDEKNPAWNEYDRLGNPNSNAVHDLGAWLLRNGVPEELVDSVIGNAGVRDEEEEYVDEVVDEDERWDYSGSQGENEDVVDADDWGEEEEDFSSHHTPVRTPPDTSTLPGLDEGGRQGYGSAPRPLAYPPYGMQQSTSSYPFMGSPYPSSSSTPFPGSSYSAYPSSSSTPFPGSSYGAYPSSSSTPFPGSSYSAYPSSSSTPFQGGSYTPYPSSSSTPFPGSSYSAYPSSSSTPFQGGSYTPYPSSSSTPFPGSSYTPYPSSGYGGYPGDIFGAFLDSDSPAYSGSSSNAHLATTTSLPSGQSTSTSSFDPSLTNSNNQPSAAELTIPPSSTITSNDNASGSGGTTAATTGTSTTAVPATLTELANRQLQAARDEHASSGSTFTLQAPTMAVGRYRVGGQPVLKTSNQRNLPGTGPRATTDNLTVLPGINTTYGNMHGEMGGVHHSLESRLAKGGEPAVLEEIGASQEICFLCEMVLSMLGIAYDHAHISRIVYPKWDDPTGKFRDEGGFLPLSALLERLGISRAEARGRLVARLTRETGDEAQAGALADRILAGELQGGRERIELIRDLRKVPSLKAASAKSKSAATTSTGRKPKTKAARREKALLDNARRMEKKRAFEEEKKSPPVSSSPLSGGVLASSAASDTEQDRPSKLSRRAEGADSPHLSALWSRLRQARQGFADGLPEDVRDTYLAATLEMVRRPQVAEDEADPLEIQSWEEAMLQSLREKFNEMGGGS